MIEIVVVTFSREERLQLSDSGGSLMEAIRNHGIGDLLAICGGCMSCGTCHVYVEPPAFDVLPPMTEGEDMLLDVSAHRSANSRLSCQIPLTTSLDGMRVRIAPEG